MWASLVILLILATVAQHFFWRRKWQRKQQQEASLLHEVATRAETTHAEWFELLATLHQHLLLSPKQEAVAFAERALLQRRFRSDSVRTTERSMPESFFQWQKWLCHSSGIALLIHAPSEWPPADWGPHWGKIAAIFEDIRHCGCSNIVLTITKESSRTRLLFAFGTSTITYEL